MTTASLESSEKSNSVSETAVPAQEAVDIGKATSEASVSTSSSESKAKSSKSQSRKPNRVRQSRIESMLSKAELARRANLSVLTVDRIEKGFGCRMNTKRKILEALGLSLADRVRVFGEEE
jgi:DNA-binding XRE family transcriptional regulator